MRFYFDIDDAELKAVNELCVQMYNNSIDVFKFRDEICKQVDDIIRSKQNEMRIQVVEQVAAKTAQIAVARKFGSEE